MARARNIKPGFFLNEELVELPFVARLLFIGLWTIADREGRLEDKPKRIKMNLFPADEVNVDEALDQLQGSGFLLRYEHAGNRYIQVLSFAKHQNPHRDEKASEIPAPCEHGANTMQEPSTNDGNRADSLIPDSLISDSGLINTPPAASAAPKKSRAASKTPLSVDFCISDAVREWAATNNVQHLDRHFTSFVTKVQAKGYVYADWDAALRNAITDDWAKLGQVRVVGQQGSKDDLATINARNNAEAKRLLGIPDDGLRVING